MKNKLTIKNTATRVIEEEARALIEMTDRIDDDFVSTVEHILRLTGRVIISGIGKSAIIAQKIVATLNSTGTPAIFMHAADAIHGDLGMIQQNDLNLVISKSGNTPEIKVLVQLMKQRQNQIVAIVGNRSSYLANHADFILDTTINREACPFDLAPTTSTTAQLAMGDALAVCLIEQRKFTDQDFAKYHPGGSLGKRLYLTVGDLSEQHGKPAVSSDATIKDVIVTITKFRVGAVAVLDQGTVIGIITDGDIRRMLENHADVGRLAAQDIMGSKPKTIDKTALAVHALTQMKNYNISQLLVTKKNKFEGIIHVQDILREGIL